MDKTSVIYRFFQKQCALAFMVVGVFCGIIIDNVLFYGGMSYYVKLNGSIWIMDQNCTTLMRSMLLAARDAVKIAQNLSQARQNHDLPIRKPLRFHTKGRTKTCTKGCVPKAEIQRNERKRSE